MVKTLQESELMYIKMCMSRLVGGMSLALGEGEPACVRVEKQICGRAGGLRQGGKASRKART